MTKNGKQKKTINKNIKRERVKKNEKERKIEQQ